MAERLGIDPDRLQLRHVGLNHLSWITAVNDNGLDRLPELLDGHAASIAEDLHLPVELVRELGAVPSYYLRYFYRFDEVLAEQRGGYRRAEEVMDLERQLLEMYADPTLDTKPSLLENRGGAWYSEAAARLLASLHDGAGDIQVVDVRNGEAVAELDPDDVVEIALPHRSRRRAPDHPATDAAGHARPRARGQGLRAAGHQGSAQRRSRGRPRRARAHPLVGPRIGDVGPLLDALLEANRAYLPRFDAVR